MNHSRIFVDTRGGCNSCMCVNCHGKSRSEAKRAYRRALRRQLKKETE